MARDGDEAEIEKKKKEQRKKGEGVSGFLGMREPERREKMRD